ncbi:hypothetical protein F4604DRAFT_1767140 [Suillus subluteus]|nr:hypothetical protein F4604DRAFT_1767140 [Suillus subluteus]
MMQPLRLTARRLHWARIGVTTNEAAAGMFFLASPLASCVTGHHDTLEVTGGRGI